jgi:hypothetical protein
MQLTFGDAEDRTERYDHKKLAKPPKYQRVPLSQFGPRSRSPHEKTERSHANKKRCT